MAFGRVKYNVEIWNELSSIIYTTLKIVLFLFCFLLNAVIIVEIVMCFCNIQMDLLYSL